MNNLLNNADKYFYPADILLPKKDIEKWAVIACDQYTSEPEYWEDVKNIVGDSPSALNIMLPEIYLSDDNSKDIERINATMRKYMAEGVFNERKDTMIYVERYLDGKVRKGLVGLIDLEDYEYKSDAKALIRATEETIEERLPARVEIRRDALLEMPHILLLFDDPTRSVVKPLESRKEEFETCYHFDLMKEGGHVHGYYLDRETITSVQNSLENLMESGDDLLFVVGDGNHSLAAAKEYYNETKDPNARYALVEIENIHDKSIEFEPIYRVLFNVDENDFLEKFKAYADENGGENIHKYDFYSKNKNGTIEIKGNDKLPVGTLQKFIKEYIKEHKEVKVDYIHGREVVKKLSTKENVLGFIFDGLSKFDFFPAIRAQGSLPRKTFSMGHAKDKRFYIETHKIKGE